MVQLPGDSFLFIRDLMKMWMDAYLSAADVADEYLETIEKKRQRLLLPL